MSVPNMFTRKLQALQFPFAKEFNVQDQEQYRSLVVWLEDEIIRWYADNRRKGLRNIHGKTWHTSAFLPYLAELQLLVGLPNEQKTGSVAMEALLNHAVSMSYSDNAVHYSQVLGSVKQPAHEVKSEKVKMETLRSQDIRAALKELATSLQLPTHIEPSQLELLKVLQQRTEHLIVQREVSEQKGDKMEVDGQDDDAEAKQAIDNMPLGFEAPDQILTHAGKVMRIMYIQDLQKLQRLINDTIVLAQEYTANPKASPRLGQVGRGG